MAAEGFWILTTKAIPRTTILKCTPGCKRFVAIILCFVVLFAKCESIFTWCVIVSFFKQAEARLKACHEHVEKLEVSDSITVRVTFWHISFVKFDKVDWFFCVYFHLARVKPERRNCKRRKTEV